MARNQITNPRKLRQLGAKIGQPVIVALTRGGTDHRIDCKLADGRDVSLYRDGTIEPFPPDVRIGHPKTSTDSSTPSTK